MEKHGRKLLQSTDTVKARNMISGEQKDVNIPTEYNDKNTSINMEIDIQKSYNNSICDNIV